MRRPILAAALAALAAPALAGPAAPGAAASFHKGVEPILEQYCYECHGDGAERGKVAFDELSDEEIASRTDLWLAALKNLRANIMPPIGKPRPSAEEEARIVGWIKYSAFGIEPANPDPGRITIRRLNRIEYGRTIKQLLGVDFPSEAEFPPDDTGNGFDDMADVLSMSPLLLEKYLQAADTVVSGLVPQTSRVTPAVTLQGRDFRDFSAESPFRPTEGDDDGGRPARREEGAPLRFTDRSDVDHAFDCARGGDYHLSFSLAIKGPFNFAPQRCSVTVKVDGVPCFEEAYGWYDFRPIAFERDVSWAAGRHDVEILVEPLNDAPNPTAQLGPDFEEKQRLEVRIQSVKLAGPMDEASKVMPADYLRFVPRGEPPGFRWARDRYARQILQDFAGRAFRRPVDEATLDRLVRLAREVDTSRGGAFELGISRAMMAILSSPRFIFRLEQPDPADAGSAYPRVDEYSLASRLSYFLWSTMPDDELLSLAAKGQLRANLHAQVARMMRDRKEEALVRNFTGQWLQARDVEFVPINAREVLGLGKFKRGDPKVDFDGETRRAMRSETEMAFQYVVAGDRSVTELVDARYTFLNEGLAKVYGIPGVAGKGMRRVELPEGSLRGGVLTEGTMLTVTSNPTRTSPVKRGQFVLENILGTPVPPPPPNIPALEATKSAFGGREPTLREMLALHRASKLCSSCHERMDSVGLSFENFNALGNYRTKDAGQPIDTAGRLVSGESFSDVRDLKRIITHQRRQDFYRCLTEKLMTYALGRGIEYYDTEAVDRIVSALERDDGRFSTLLLGIIDSAPFQRQRVPSRAPPPMAMSAPAPIAAAIP
jgi:hypothetical protein